MHLNFHFLSNVTGFPALQLKKKKKRDKEKITIICRNMKQLKLFLDWLLEAQLIMSGVIEDSDLVFTF